MTSLWRWYLRQPHFNRRRLLRQNITSKWRRLWRKNMTSLTSEMAGKVYHRPLTGPFFSRLDAYLIRWKALSQLTKRPQSCWRRREGKNFSGPNKGKHKLINFSFFLCLKVAVSAYTQLSKFVTGSCRAEWCFKGTLYRSRPGFKPWQIKKTI